MFRKYKRKRERESQELKGEAVDSELKEWKIKFGVEIRYSFKKKKFFNAFRCNFSTR